MKIEKLPKRVFSSPLIEYANFNNGASINLIKLVKPYANGDSYALADNIGNASGLFKSHKQAKSRFHHAVICAEWNYEIISQGRRLKDDSFEKEIPFEVTVTERYEKTITVMASNVIHAHEVAGEADFTVSTDDYVSDSFQIQHVQEKKL